MKESKPKRASKVRPKLAWFGDGWMCTLVRLNSSKADRTIDFIHKSGQKFTLELSPHKGNKNYVGVKLSWSEVRDE